MVNIIRSAFSDLLNRPILLALMSVFLVIVLGELDFLDTKPILWLKNKILADRPGSEFLTKVLDKAEKYVYAITLNFGILVLVLFVRGVPYLTIIGLFCSAILYFIDINKEIFASTAVLILLVYFYFTIKDLFLRIGLFACFVAVFWYDLTSADHDKKKPGPIAAKDPASRKP